MNYNIPYGRQDINDEDIVAVTQAIQSDFLTQGPQVVEFERKFANYIGSNYAVAVSNGTAALHLSAMALDVQPGDKVITTPITFVASANCIKYCGGEIVFADIDPDTYLLDPNKVRELLESSPKGTYKGIIPVDFAGLPIKMDKFRKMADEFDLWIIEDSCHAPGGYFTDEMGKEQFCGNSIYADLAIFSFHPVKHIATGEGGMITTNNKSLYEKLCRLRTHGISKDTLNFVNSIDVAIGEGKNDSYPGWYMEMHDLGYNYRLTDFQAALGSSQLKRATDGLTKRRVIAKIYWDAFRNKSFIHGQSGYIDGHAYHLYIIEVDDRLGLYNHLRDKNIFTQIHYIPAHLMPFYKNQGWRKGDFPLAEKYYSHCISLPMFPTLKSDEINYVIDSVNEYYG